MHDSIKKRSMRVNVNKNKVMVLERIENITVFNAYVKVEQVKGVVHFTNDGKYDRDIERRVNSGNKLALTSIRYRIPSQRTNSALVASLELRVTLGDDGYSLSGGLHVIIWKRCGSARVVRYKRSADAGRGRMICCDLSIRPPALP
ncbi:hypothetical protein EVAR_61818_1 [Eumeta japonica]|uniref:Uncharacterized protein n=1 Tax=Eumeta variegata TaxID=151549 RepID=A0A4C1YWP6_EUMVA|nr:hypothetical protein EVAR_61818_1 [Eumeta japonica]